MIVNIRYERTEYGYADVEVPENATEEEILNIADEAERNGQVVWCNETVNASINYKENK